MLVLSRKQGETIVVGTAIRVTVLEMRGGRVRLGIEAPSRVNVRRQELDESDAKYPPLRVGPVKALGGAPAAT
ncbi:MAG: carbon storage regulator [Pirellulales bacterium]|nr:carbon storage regulator [Pirellulales bacterium]